MTSMTWVKVQPVIRVTVHSDQDQDLDLDQGSFYDQVRIKHVAMFMVRS